MASILDEGSNFILDEASGNILDQASATPPSSAVKFSLLPSTSIMMSGII